MSHFDEAVALIVQALNKKHKAVEAKKLPNVTLGGLETLEHTWQVIDNDEKIRLFLVSWVKKAQKNERNYKLSETTLQGMEESQLASVLENYGVTYEQVIQAVIVFFIGGVLA